MTLPERKILEEFLGIGMHTGRFSKLTVNHLTKTYGLSKVSIAHHQALSYSEGKAYEQEQRASHGYQ